MTDRQPDIEELLCDYIDGTLDGPRRQEVDALLAQDAELRKTVRDMMQVRGMLKDLPAEKAPSHVAQAIRQEIETPPVLRWSMPFALRLAASLLLTATVALAIWSVLPSTQQSPIAAGRPAADRILADRERDYDAMKFKSDARTTVALAPAATPPAGIAMPVAPAMTAPMAKVSEDKALSSEAIVAEKGSAGKVGLERPRSKAEFADAISQKAADAGAVAAAPAQVRGPLNAAAQPAGAPGMPPGMQQQQQALLANAPQVIIVRASDIPAVQREIDAMLGANNRQTIASNAGPSYELVPQPNMEMKKEAGGGAGGRPVASKSAAPAAKPQPQAAQEFAKQAPSSDARLAGGLWNNTTQPNAQESIVVHNLSPDQVQVIRDNVLALGDRRKLEVIDQTFAGEAERRQEQQILRQDELGRKMPSAQTIDLQAARRLRQAADEPNQVAQQAMPQKMDLTIILELRQLPAAAAPATLPASLPGQQAQPGRR